MIGKVLVKLGREQLQGKLYVIPGNDLERCGRACSIVSLFRITRYYRQSVFTRSKFTRRFQLRRVFHDRLKL